MLTRRPLDRVSQQLLPSFLRAPYFDIENDGRRRVSERSQVFSFLKGRAANERVAAVALLCSTFFLLNGTTPPLIVSPRVRPVFVACFVFEECCPAALFIASLRRSLSLHRSAFGMTVNLKERERGGESAVGFGEKVRGARGEREKGGQ